MKPSADPTVGPGEPNICVTCRLSGYTPAMTTSKVYAAHERYAAEIGRTCDALTRLIDANGPRATPELTSRLKRLSPRESEILCLVAQGESNQEIAQGLFIGETTVKTHIGRIQTKLEARDLVQLVVLAHRAGLV